MFYQTTLWDESHRRPFCGVDVIMGRQNGFHSDRVMPNRNFFGFSNIFLFTSESLMSFKKRFIARFVLSFFRTISNFV